VRSVGEGSVWLNIALLIPFVALIIFALGSGRAGGAVAVPLRHVDLLGGCSSPCGITWAGTISRPSRVKWKRRNARIPEHVRRCDFGCGELLLPLSAVARTGIDPNSWTTGGWVDVAQSSVERRWPWRLHRGVNRRDRIVQCAMPFVHAAAAGDGGGRLPAACFHANRSQGPPWVAILACAILWAICFPLGFERSLILDVLLTGLSILLEFWALVALRIREPELKRPFPRSRRHGRRDRHRRAASGADDCSVVRNRAELVGATNELALGIAIVARELDFIF